jgi:thymidylate synthase
VELNKERVSVLEFRREDITLVGYESLSALKAAVAV